MEPRAGVEPAIKVLPTYALPLGDRGNPNLQDLLRRDHGPKVTPPLPLLPWRLHPRSRPEKEQPPGSTRRLLVFLPELAGQLHAPCGAVNVP